MSRWKKLLLTATVAVAVVGLLAVAGGYLGLRQRAVDYAAPEHAPTPKPQDLQTFRNTRIYFGHQSVGENILVGLESLYRDAGDLPPSVQAVTSVGQVQEGGGHLVHSLIGENGMPDTKMTAFAAMMRSGMADRVDVALMKLCYVDFGRRTDPREVFDHYRTTMADLEREFPQVRFVYSTVPLTTTDDYVNNLRTQFNSLVRMELKDKVILDIAEVESRSANGSRATASTFGFPYERLQPAYASDGAHLNTDGAKRVAASLVASVAETRHSVAR